MNFTFVTGLQFEFDILFTLDSHFLLVLLNKAAKPYYMFRVLC